MVWFQLWGGDGLDLLDKGNDMISVAEGKKLKHEGLQQSLACSLEVTPFFLQLVRRVENSSR
ncbi:hypothetical protein DY000_02021311 [Brassica cretica]|uniref:Uncharacterized protein n=1 Tax=Brassica cretica TaxID=69181 RepID=A0ABQ7E9V0_BRACR|nr:hypothetical protein DY000_02021311 [Brassica cretica]